MTGTVAIVGAGSSGLACSRALAGLAHAVVVERRAAVEGHADVLLATTALRWDGRVLVAMGRSGPVEIAAGALVIATGARPLGRAELGLAGTRPAGVLPAPAACDLVEHGLLRCSEPVVVGGGDWAARAVDVLLAAGAERVTVVAPDGILAPLPASARVAVHEGLRPTAIAGRERVERLVCDGAAFDCDAIVLAHGLTPVRNVDGAVSEGIRTAYAQPLDDPGSAAGAQAAGAEAAAAALELLGTA